MRVSNAKVQLKPSDISSSLSLARKQLSRFS